MISAPYVAALLMPNPVLLADLLAVIIFLLWRFRRHSVSERRHRRYRATADRVYTRLRQLSGDGQRMSYLRKINPYVFEELLLLAFERQGYAVQRNASYSGDGGLDGRVHINGECWLIQAKRYSRAITPAHVQDFDALLTRMGQRGLFIHTGRTGQKSRTASSSSQQLMIISGQRLLALLAGKPFKEFSL
ncbi:restriction endonuclease [Pantoea rodasii]|uniref:Restriction endonuclease n=1 Tax=Pantoea rodasii TaxID=1076549 RepID=A0A2M9W9K5_9GAMM|nr:restriction endonuclease [Pantoea rodasii]PJZ04195.1 restriction endonuclease [Pantoea rodasii]